MFYLQENYIIHRDIKIDNCLLSSQGLLKLCDFGHAIKTLFGADEYCGTHGYIAPEVGVARYTNKVDNYSIGVVCYEMVTGNLPIDYIFNYGTIDSTTKDFISKVIQ